MAALEKTGVCGQEALLFLQLCRRQDAENSGFDGMTFLLKCIRRQIVGSGRQANWQQLGRCHAGTATQHGAFETRVTCAAAADCSFQKKHTESGPEGFAQ